VRPRPSGHCRAWAETAFSPALGAFVVQAGEKDWPSASKQADPRAGLDHSWRESLVACATHPRRGTKTRNRGFGTNRFPFRVLSPFTDAPGLTSRWLPPASGSGQQRKASGWREEIRDHLCQRSSTPAGAFWSVTNYQDQFLIPNTTKFSVRNWLRISSRSNANLGRINSGTNLHCT
jgi:hypothetical protein